MTAEALPSTTPSSAQEALEARLEPLLQSLLEIGICASDVQEAALESAPSGAGSGYPGGLLGKKAAQTVDHLSRLHMLKDSVSNVFIPLDVIKSVLFSSALPSSESKPTDDPLPSSVDQGRNPQMYTRDFVERVAGENMYTNGILSGVENYGGLLDKALGEAFPDLAGLLVRPRGGGGQSGSAGTGVVGNGLAEGQGIKMEEG